MKSHIIAISQPPPSAKPATAAMTGLRQRPIRSPGEEIVSHHLREAAPAHFLDIGPSRESAVRAGQDKAADAVVRLQYVEGGVQLGDQRRVERVQRFGPVEGNQADALLPLDEMG